MWLPIHDVQKFHKVNNKILIQEMVTCMNIFLCQNGISSELSLSEIMLWSSNTDYNKLRIAFRAYA